MKYKVNLHFVYPEDQHAHMIDPEQTHKNDLDAKYNYYNTSFWYKSKRFLMNAFMQTIGRLIIFFRYKPHYFGKENIKKYKDVLKNGFVSVCNHVFDWDFLVLRNTITFKKGFVLLWHNNHNRKIGNLIHNFGSVPIPKDDIGASLKMHRDIKRLLDDGQWLHIYAEESMWYFYQGVREFRNGASYIACHNNKPILPLSISFRPATGLCKLWKKDYPNVNVTIGEPIFPNENLPIEERIKDLTKRSHDIVESQLWDHTPDVE